MMVLAGLLDLHGVVESGAGSHVADPGAGIVEEVGEHGDALQGDALEFGVGKVDRVPAHTFQLVAEDGVLHPPVECGAVDVGGLRGLSQGRGRGEVRHGHRLPVCQAVVNFFGCRM